MKILIVDDDIDNAKMYSTQLQNRGYKTKIAGSASECFRILGNNTDIDLLLLDLMMPKVSGHEVLEILREKYSALQLPIIMLTSSSDVEKIIRCLKNGANDYLVKPMIIEVAIERLKTQYSLSQLYKEHLEKESMERVLEITKHSNHELNTLLNKAFKLLAECKIKKSQKILIEIYEVIDQITKTVKKVNLIADK